MIFNSFNFIAHEFSVRGNLLEIEDRLKGNSVLTIGKRRLFSRKRRIIGTETSFSDPKDFVLLRKDAVLFS